jgi:molecular chaperone DnaK
MVKDAESHAADDEKKRELIDLRNKADQLVYSTEKTLADHGDKVDAAERGEIERSINQLKDSLKADDAGAIQTAMDAVTKAAHKLAEEMYKKQAAEAGATAGGPGDETAEGGSSEANSESDEVIDAEYEVKSE